jgi:hypothetical protein
MKSRTLHFPVKKKLGTIAARTKGKHLTQMKTMEAAIEAIVVRVESLERIHQVNDAELRETHSMGHNSGSGMTSFLKEFNRLRRDMQTLRARVERDDPE